MATRKSVIRFNAKNKVAPEQQGESAASSPPKRVSLAPTKLNSKPKRSTVISIEAESEKGQDKARADTDTEDEREHERERDREKKLISLRRRKGSLAQDFLVQQALAEAQAHAHTANANANANARASLEPTSSIDSLYRNREQIKPRATRWKRTSQWMRRSLFKIGFDDTENYLFAFASWEVMEKSSGRLTHVLDYLVYRMLELFTSIVFLVYFASRRRLPPYGIGFWSQVLHILYSGYYAYKIYSLDEARQRVTTAADEGEAYYKTLAELFNNPAKLKPDRKVSDARDSQPNSQSELTSPYTLNTLKRANIALWVFANLQYIAVIEVVFVDWITIAAGLRKSQIDSLYNTFTMIYAVADVFAVSFPIRLGHVIYSWIYIVIYAAGSIAYNLIAKVPSYKVLDWINAPAHSAGMVGLFFLGALGVQFLLVGLFRVRHIIMVYGADAPELELPSDFETVANLDDVDGVTDKDNEGDGGKGKDGDGDGDEGLMEHQVQHPEGPGGRLIGIQDNDGLTTFKMLRDVTPEEFQAYLTAHEGVDENAPTLTPAERQNLLEEYDQVLKARGRERTEGRQRQEKEPSKRIDSEAERVQRSFTRMKFQAASKEFTKLFEKVRKSKVKAEGSEEGETKTESAANSVFEIAGTYFDENYKPSSEMLARSRTEEAEGVEGRELHEGGEEETVKAERPKPQAQVNEEVQEPKRNSDAVPGRTNVNANANTKPKKLGLDKALQQMVLGRGRDNNATATATANANTSKKVEVGQQKGLTATPIITPKPKPTPNPATATLRPPPPPMQGPTVTQQPPPQSVTQTLRKVKRPVQVLTKRSVTQIKKTDLLPPSNANATNTRPPMPMPTPSQSGYTLGPKPKDDAIVPNLRKAKGHRNLHDLETAPEPLGDKGILIVPKGDGQKMAMGMGKQKSMGIGLGLGLQSKIPFGRETRSRTQEQNVGGDQPSNDHENETGRPPEEPQIQGTTSTSSDRIRVLRKAKSLKRLAKLQRERAAALAAELRPRWWY